MIARSRRDSRAFRPLHDPLEVRLVMSGQNSVPAEVRAILAAAHGLSPVRPNTPVLPLLSPTATATFIDPSVTILGGNRIKIRQRDYIAPNVTLDASKGVITIGLSTAIQNDARLIAGSVKASNSTGIFVGDNVLIGDGVTIKGPAAIGSSGGAVTSIGPNALIDGAIIKPGAFVGALARVGPGVTVPTGYRVLPGANVTTNAQASNPALGKVVKVAAGDASATNAAKEIANSSALAIGYVTLYQGNSATGGTASAGPIPAQISAPGSTTFFGALNTVLGASSEPGSKTVPFEPTSGSPTFLAADGSLQTISANNAYRFPARFIGSISVANQRSQAVAASLGKGVTIRADEGQPIKIGSISQLGDGVSIRSPRGGVQGSTTTTVVTTVTDTVTKTTTTTTTATTTLSTGAPSATAGTTTSTTTGINAAGHATTGTVSTTIAVKSSNLGTITIGDSFTARNGAVILGSPTSPTVLGNAVTIGSGSVIVGSTIAGGVTVGSRAYIANSTIAAGTVVPDGTILINNVILGTIQW